MPILILILLLVASNVDAAGAPVRIDDGDTLTDQEDIAVSSTAVLIKASNANRATLNCQVSDEVRWGTSAVTATRGQTIQAGVTVAIKNTSSIYMIATGTSATVSCTEESYSSSTGTVFSP